MPYTELQVTTNFSFLRVLHIPKKWWSKQRGMAIHQLPLLTGIVLLVLFGHMLQLKNQK